MASDGFGGMEATGDLHEGCFGGVVGTDTLSEQAEEKMGDEHEAEIVDSAFWELSSKGEQKNGSKKKKKRSQKS